MSMFEQISVHMIMQGLVLNIKPLLCKATGHNNWD